MKRTKQTYFRQFPSQPQTHQMSGCREFEGQDLKYDARKQFFKNKQRQWLDQQMEQKRQQEAEEKFEKQMYENQAFELNRMRGMLQDNFQQTKDNMVCNTKKTNQQLDLQRKTKEHQTNQAKLQREKDQSEYLKQRGAKQQFYMDVK